MKKIKIVFMSLICFLVANVYSAPVEETWLSNNVPSLKNTYHEYFDSFGIAVEYGNFGLSCKGNKYTGQYEWNKSWGNPVELYYEDVRNGLKKQADSITTGNELKPQFLLQWWNGDGSGQRMVDFTASNGKTIKVPESLNGEQLIYAVLSSVKKMGIKMRGHVLTWHSQTPDGFFAEGYKPKYNGELLANPVDKETMTARHEWYIKTVLGCVDAWEKANGYGKGNHIIWAWDVVNEAMADDAGKVYTGESQNWLRGSTANTKNKKPDNGGSRWFQIYGNEEFIVNAFRFANAYAPSDVKLCYNDYNEYMDYGAGWKTSAILHVIEVIKAGEAKKINGKNVAPRFDVIGMQSHVGVSWPGVNGYESALKRFLKVADVHVTEIDISAKSPEEAQKTYGDYFNMLKKYGKKYSGEHKIINVTVWGINNENSWINRDGKTYPLLFSKQNNVYKPNDSFWAVINAAK